MKRKNADSKYKWNLLELYKTNELFLKDLDLYFDANKNLLRFEKKLNNPESLIEFLKENELAEKINSKLNHFLKHLNVEQNNKRVSELQQIYENKLQYFDDKFTFIAEEIKKVGYEKIKIWCNENEYLKFYLKDYKEFFKNIKYLLPELDRKLISKVSNSSSMIYEMYDILKYKDKDERDVKFKNKNYKLDQNTISDILENSDPIKDQELRKFLSLEYRKYNKNKMHTFTKVYEAIVLDEIETAKLVGMKNFKEYFFEDEYFSFENFNKLISFAKNNSKIYFEYYSFIKKYFKFENNFYGTDSNLTLTKNFKYKIDVDEAQKIIKDSVKIFGIEYSKILEKCFENNKIDYFEDTNKSLGAFTINSYNFDSLISINFTDDLDSLFTLTHEVGHFAHFEFVKKHQPKQYAGFDNIIAEVASTLNEHLLFDHLIKVSDSKDFKIKLLQQRIEFIFSNFFSAISEAWFEFNIFEYLSNNETLTVDIIERISKSTSKEILGETIFNSSDIENHKYGWISTSHFFDQPFYIYKYAVSIAISFKLFENIKKGDITSSLEFLKTGGSLFPKEIFEKFNFDLSNNEFFMPLINETNEMILQLKELLKTQN